jgi:hypothetical protein
MPSCSSCGADIWWALSFTTGRRMPIDATPTPDGNVLLAESRPDGTPVVRVVGKPAAAGPDLFSENTEPRFTSHFATCPQADSHRRTR